MSRWLAAREFGTTTKDLRMLCRTVLADLGAWLDADHEQYRRHALALLRGRRGTGLAGSFISEFLKSEGLLDRLPRDARAAVIDTIDAFFSERPISNQPRGGEDRHRGEPKGCDSGSSRPAIFPESGA
ncbi:MAG: hypothetical protein ACYTGZ_04710 [Planctomycetota bacterium]|jgi:hypothetical protein